MKLEKWIRRLLKFSAAVAILSVLALVFGLLIERFRGAAALKSRLAELTASGERLKVVGLEPVRPAPGLDAAAALLAFTNRLSWNLAGFTRLLPPSGRLAEPGRQVATSQLSSWSFDGVTNTWTELRATLARDPALAADIHEALRKQGWNDGADYRNGFLDFQTANLVFWKELGQFLPGIALIAIRDGETESALVAMEDSIRLLKLQANSPLIINQMVRRACAAFAWNASWELVVSGRCTGLQLARLQSAWEGMDFCADMARAMEMERAMTLDHFEMIIGSAAKRELAVSQIEDAMDYGMSQTVPVRGPVFRYVHMPLWRFAWARQDQLRSLNQWQKAIEFDRLVRTNSWSQASVGATSVDEEQFFLSIVPDDSEKTGASLYDRTRFVFSGMTFSIGSTTTRMTVEAEIQRRMMVTAIALQRYRIRHGRFPDQLAALVPGFLREVPVDLMHGKPISYRLGNDSSPLLYSVSEDGQDDGGDFTPRGGTKPFRKIWDGKDAVWPAPASPEAAEKAAHRK